MAAYRRQLEEPAVSGDVVHRYRSHATWRGSTAVGYDAYDRSHEVRATPAGAALALSSDPAFRGDARRLNPEVLLVASASSCQLLSFLAVAARARVDVAEYDDDAEGVMPEAERPMRITRIVLRPRITVRGDVDPSRLEHLVDVAHRECFIANSLRTEVVVEPTFVAG
jgi:organic hydroperoxide reductase OsmC/OhrA